MSWDHSRRLGMYDHLNDSRDGGLAIEISIKEEVALTNAIEQALNSGGW